MQSRHIREMLAEFAVIRANPYDERPVFDERYLVHAPSERVLYGGSWQDGYLPVEGIGGAERSRWIGERPTLPDYRPAIGRAPRLANVYCGYGHQHVGLTLATATGRLIERQMAGEELPEALKACDPGRFG